MGKILDFILSLLDSIFTTDDKYVLWIKGEIANLIKEGTKKDDNAFDKEYLPKIKEIIFNLIENREDKIIEDDNLDLVTHTLNSVNGKALHALINYALRYGRLNSSQEVK